MGSVCMIDVDYNLSSLYNNSWCLEINSEADVKKVNQLRKLYGRKEQMLVCHLTKDYSCRLDSPSDINRNTLIPFVLLYMI